MPSSVVVVVGNPRIGSRTGAVAAAVADAVRAGADFLAVRTIELAEAIAITFDDATEPINPQPDALDVVRTARVLVVATPSYKGSYTGLLKVFFDQLSHQELAGVAAIPVTVAGAPAHLRTTTADLTRLLTELGAVVPSTVELLESELDDIDLKVSTAARETVAELLAVSPTS